MTTDLDRDELRRIRDLAEMFVEEHGWSLMDMDLRNILSDHGLPRSDRAERELGDHAVWLLS